MLRTILSLLAVPVLFASTGTKKTRGKRESKPARQANARPVRRRAEAPRAKANGKRAKANGKTGAASSAGKKTVPVREEPAAKPVEVLPPPPPPVAPKQAPGLFSPQAGESADSLTPSFRWFYVGGASHYQLVWSSDTSFHRPHILLTNQTAASLPPEQALEPGTNYVWRVRGGNEGGWGPWSATRSFRTPES